MKLKSWCLFLILATAGAIGFGLWRMYGAMYPHQDGAEVVLRMAVPYGSGHPSAQAAEHFAQRVEEESGGEIRVQVYPDGQLGDGESAVEQLRCGGIALAILSAFDLPQDGVALAEEEGGYPGGTLYVLPQALDSYGLEAVAVYESDCRCIANNRGELRPGTLALTLRAHSSQVLLQRLEGLGFQVAEGSGSGLEAAVTYGDIDGVEITLMEYASEGYANLLPYLALFSGPLAPDVIVASRAAMSGLSIQQQNILRACGEESGDYQRELLPQAQARAVAELAEQGVRLTPQAAVQTPPEEWASLWPLYYGARRGSEDGGA